MHATLQAVRCSLPLLLASLILNLNAGLPVIPDAVQANIRQRVDYGYTSGMIVGLRNSAGTTYFSYGQTSRKTTTRVDEHTLFEIGSITKVFTSTLLADLAQANKLDLHDFVETHLPPHIHAPTFRGQSITLAHLASHTSGLPSTPSNLISTDGSNPFADYSPGAMLEFLNSFTLTRAPGARYEYSNYGAGLLGYLLAELCQTTCPLLVKQQITDVLQLNDTTIELNPEQRTRLAQGYSGVVPTPEFRMGTLEGAGALRSTAHDVLDFLAANRGWIPSPLQSAMLSAHQPYTTTPTPGLQVGLGWHRLTTWSALTTNTIWDIITLEDSPHLPRRFFRTLKLPGE